MFLATGTGGTQEESLYGQYSGRPLVSENELRKGEEKRVEVAMHVVSDLQNQQPQDQ